MHIFYEFPFNMKEELHAQHFNDRQQLTTRKALV